MGDQASGFHVDGPAITAAAAKIESASETLRRAQVNFVGSPAKAATDGGTLPDGTSQSNYSADYQAMSLETRRLGLNLLDVAKKLRKGVDGYQSSDGDAASDIDGSGG